MTPRAIALFLAVAAVSAGATGAYVTVPRYDTLTRVIDGDTIVINGSTHVRLWGIDAPELEQQCTRPSAAFAGGIRWDCGKSSRDYLRSMLALSVKLQCERRTTDAHKRTVAQCFVINTSGQRHDIGKSLVSAGYALNWGRYSAGYYAADQVYAQFHKLGVWSGGFQLPWAWRQERSK